MAAHATRPLQIAAAALVVNEVTAAAVNEATTAAVTTCRMREWVRPPAERGRGHLPYLEGAHLDVEGEPFIRRILPVPAAAAARLWRSRLGVGVGQLREEEKRHHLPK